MEEKIYLPLIKRQVALTTIICHTYSIQPNDFLSDNRTYPYSEARHIYMHIMSAYYGYDYKAITSLFGRTVNRKTVYYADAKISSWVKVYKEIRARVDLCVRLMKSVP